MEKMVTITFTKEELLSITSALSHCMGLSVGADDHEAEMKEINVFDVNEYAELEGLHDRICRAADFTRLVINEGLFMKLWPSGVTGETPQEWPNANGSL